MFSWPKFEIIALKHHMWKTNTKSYMTTFSKNIQLPCGALALLLLWLTLDTRVLSWSIKYLIFHAEFSLDFIILACWNYLCQQSCSRVASKLLGYLKILAPMHLWFSMSRTLHCAVCSAAGNKRWVGSRAQSMFTAETCLLECVGVNP